MATLERYKKRKYIDPTGMTAEEFVRARLAQDREDIDPKGMTSQEFVKARLGLSDDDFAPVANRFSNISRESDKEQEEEKPKERTWFQKSESDSVIGTILGSGADLLEKLGTGVIGMGEQAVDKLMYLAPAFNAGQQAQNNPYYRFDINEYRQQQEDSRKFIEKDLYDEEKVAKFLISDQAKKVGIDAEKHSVFGEKSDALAQSAGQLAGTIGLQAAGVPWFVTTGMTSFGGEVESALKDGASYEMAGLSAAVTAGADILTEKLFGGSGLGEKGLINLDKVTQGMLTKTLAQKVARKVAEFGIDVVGEGAEEVASGIFSNLGTSLYKEENLKDILFSEEALDEYLESFIGGAVLGGGMNSVKLGKSIANDTDYRVDRTQNEQKVFDAALQKRISEEETGGKKLNKRERAEIEKQVQNELEKGYIDLDTIESTLGGETYESYKSITEQEETLQKEFDTLNKMKQGEMTGEQVDRRTELKTQLEELKNNSNKAELKDKLSLEVKELVKNDRLSESYNEKTRRSEKFTVDLTKYDEKQQAVVKKAVESGILNNTNRTHEFVDMIAKISADKGVSFDFTNNAKLKESGFALEGKTINGYVKDGNIALNIDSKKALNTVVGHEITHVLEGTDLYTELQSIVKDYATTKGEYKTRFDELTKAYEGIEGVNIEQEVTADLIGDYLFTDSDFVSRLSVEKPSVFKKIYDEIKYLVKTVTSGKEARQLAKLQRVFEKAYNTSSNAENSEITKFSMNVERYLEAYSETQKENWKNSKKIVLYESESQLKQFVEDAKERKNPGKKLYFGKIKSEVADRIKSELSYDVKGYNCALYSDNIRKIFKDHGDVKKESPRGQRIVEVDDFSRIPEIISDPEKIESGGMYNNNPVIRFTKDGITIAGVVADGALDLYTQTMYINKKNRSLATAIDEQAPINTPETTRSTASNDIVPQNGRNASVNIESENQKYSLGEETARARGWNVYGKDIALEAPVQETVETESLETSDVKTSDKASDNVVDEYAPLTEAEANERDAQQADRINTLDEAPPEAEAPYYGEEEPAEVKDPFEDRDIREVGDRKQKAYMYENPEVKPYFQEEAKIMLGELQRSVKGQRHFNDQVYYDTNGESGWFGTTRETSDEIAYLLDEFKYTYADLEKGLKAIIEDNGKENNAISKRIEFMLDERLREGHTDFETNTDIPANEEYINLLREKQIVDYSDEAFEMWARTLAETEPADTIEMVDAPVDEVQVLYSLEAEQQEKVAEVDSAVSAEETADTPEFSVNESYNAKLENYRTAIEGYKTAKSTIETAFDEAINKKTAEYNSLKRKDTNRASNLLTQIENLKLRKSNNVTTLDSKIARVEGIVENMVQNEASWKQKKLASRRVDYHKGIVDKIKNAFSSKGFDFDKVLESAKNKGTFASVDNTPQRFIEKSLGYKEGQILNDLTVNKVAQNESKGIKWINSYTDKKSGLLTQIAKEYGIKPRSKESASAQMYAEGFWVDDDGNFIKYGDAELAKDYPDAKVRDNIKKLAKDPRIRQIYDETLGMINASRLRNLYPEIPRRSNYFLHFREMDDTFSRLGIPFNPNDIKLKDLPTDINGMTADLKPGQPYFASAHQRMGCKTNYDLLGGVERYLNSAKNQIYHIDDIQTLRALRNYIADTYGQAHGLESLDSMTEEEAVARIEEVYNSHLSTFAKFLNEEANVIAGKTSLTDRGLEGVIGRRGIQFLDTVNRQVGSNMVGFNVSSALTNTVSAVQAVAKSNKFDATKAFAQTVSNKISSVFGKTDGFVENSPLMIRRKGIEKLTKTPWESVTDKGYLLMGAIDNISSEFIVRTKFNELTRKGMSEQQAHVEADKWASRILGDRSLGQQPQLYNSKMLGLVTKFQLEVRNQLDSQFYDTIQEAKVSNEDIENGFIRNMKVSAKVGATFFQLAVLQHMFGKAFESVAGYNPAFDIVEVLAQLFGFDDDEESEDTPLDNLEQGFLTLLGDLPYTSSFTGGGRIPISSALPIEQFVSGKDSYGNEKSRWDTIKETAPYYLMPAGYGQLKKTTQGLGMFSDEHPVAGSYTDSGNLRFPIEDTPANRVRSAIFGQYASPEARDYFDNERSPLKEKQIQEYKDLELPIREYWDYREGLKEHDKLEDKFDYIAGLDLPVEKKNIMINNIVDRKEAVDLTNYDEFDTYEEFDFATKNPEKYEFLQSNNVTYKDYKSNEDAKEEYDAAYNWVKQNPEKVVVSKAIADNVVEYRQYVSAINKIEADKDSDGKTINGSGKQKKTEYINNLNLDYGQKIILYRSMFDSEKDKDEYNADIVEYLSDRSDITYEEKIGILELLGMQIDADGTVRW